MGDRHGLGLPRSLHPMKPAGTALRPAEPRCITISCETTLPQKAIATRDQRLHSSAPLPTKSSCMRRKPGKQHRSLRPTKTQSREAQVLSEGCIHFIRPFSLNITAPFQCRNPLSLRSWQANLLRNADGGFHLGQDAGPSHGGIRSKNKRPKLTAWVQFRAKKTREISHLAIQDTKKHLTEIARTALR